LVQGCFDGFNGTVFAYGQTGSGKTHSMMGVFGDVDEEGIVPKTIKDFFAISGAKQGTSKILYGF
jgi:kinesin family member 3A